MKTTLITGASEGIGYEFAKLFAQKGHDLILVARNENRLLSISHELSAQNVSVKYFAKDLSILENAKIIYEELKAQNVKIEYLINNAGFGINDQYIDIEWQRELEMFNLNMIALAYFTKVFAKDMKERGFGKILNLGSTGSFQPGPFMAGYCATKAFVLSLSEAVNYELKGTNVRVSTLCPGVTDSKFHEVAKTGKSSILKLSKHATSKEVAEFGYKIMMNGKASAVHGFMNKLMVFSNRFASRGISTSVAGRLMKTKN